MAPPSSRSAAALLLALAASMSVEIAAAREVVRPQEVKSKRQVVYDAPTYGKLAALWKDYNEAYPSEYAYANWMYAARYAGDAQYTRLLARGVKKYPANPTLLYLKAIEKHAGGSAEERALLERAVALDPTYMDPWFSLAVDHLWAGEDERLDVALRRILASGIVSDDVMDYNHNVLIGLEPNAILVTNGDNDTYPAWILTRVLKVRSDVAIVNRSLLNTDWYPLRLVERGLPRFTDAGELEALRKGILQELEAKKANPPPGGPFPDPLIVKIVEAARRAGRPVYLAKTVFLTAPLERLAEEGRDLGLVTLVTPGSKPYSEQLQRAYAAWLDSFRTGGLDGWRLRSAPETDAGRMLVPNYVAALVGDLDSLRVHAPELRASLFRWYIQHIQALLPGSFEAHVATAWCEQSDVEEIAAWCKRQGLGKQGQGM